jgi:hypothetical protein
MVMIEWQLDLQLPVQSVPISTKVVSSNPADGEVYSIQHYVIKLSPGNPVSSTIKTDRHDIAEILFKAALSTITLSLRRYTDLLARSRLPQSNLCSTNPLLLVNMPATLSPGIG